MSLYLQEVFSLYCTPVATAEIAMLQRKKLSVVRLLPQSVVVGTTTRLHLPSPIPCRELRFHKPTDTAQLVHVDYVPLKNVKLSLEKKINQNRNGMEGCRSFQL